MTAADRILSLAWVLCILIINVVDQVYSPRTRVTDSSVIDLDQKLLERQLAITTEESFLVARHVYERGAHAQPYAQLQLAAPFTQYLMDGTNCMGLSVTGEAIFGTFLYNVVPGDTVLWFRYVPGVNQADNDVLLCHVGGNPEPQLEYCLANSGLLQIYDNSPIAEIVYAYNPLMDNQNIRTLQSFSLTAREKFWECPFCPFNDFAKFWQYYGVMEYSDQWVLAALTGGQPQWDESAPASQWVPSFDSYSLVGRAEAVKKGTVEMSLFMAVIGEMESELSDCSVGKVDVPAHNWDLAVAYYTGYEVLVQSTGEIPEFGLLMYAQAEQMCLNFGTCRPDNNDILVTTQSVSETIVLQDTPEEIPQSLTNVVTFREFEAGRNWLAAGNCVSAQNSKVRIVHQMTAVLVQSTLHYAYIHSVSPREKSHAERMSSAAALLPFLHDRDTEVASLVSQSMARLSSVLEPVDFVAVKKALEATYSCMGITCDDIGGLVDMANGGYFVNAEPCDGWTPTQAPNTNNISTTLEPSPSPSPSPIAVGNNNNAPTSTVVNVTSPSPLAPSEEIIIDSTTTSMPTATMGPNSTMEPSIPPSDIASNISDSIIPTVIDLAEAQDNETQAPTSILVDEASSTASPSKDTYFDSQSGSSSSPVPNSVACNKVVRLQSAWVTLMLGASTIVCFSSLF